MLTHVHNHIKTELHYLISGYTHTQVSNTFTHMKRQTEKTHIFYQIKRDTQKHPQPNKMLKKHLLTLYCTYFNKNTNTCYTHTHTHIYIYIYIYIYIIDSKKHVC